MLAYHRRRSSREAPLKCYQHPAHDAFASCRACAKGVCSDCAVELTFGLACSERCATRARALDALVDRSAVVYSAAQPSLLPRLIIGAGVLVAMAGFALPFARGTLPLEIALGGGAILAAMGLMLTAFGIASSRMRKKLQSADGTKR